MDDERLTAYVADHFDRLVRLAYVIGGDWQGAEDAVQSALVRVWGRLRRPGDVEALHAYVRTAVHHELVSQSRKRRPTPTDAEPQERTEDFAPGVDARRDGLNALAALSPKQRAVLALRYLEDLDDPTIAEMMSCSLGSVKKHAARGLAALRESTTTDARRTP